MKNIKKILLLSVILVLIPLLSYSQELTHPINQKQLKEVLQDKAKLEYYKKQEIINDSIESLQENKINNLYQIISSNKIIQQNQVIEIDYYKSAYTTEKRKNKLIIVGSGVLVTGITYLYIQK